MRYANAVCGPYGPVLFKTSVWEVLTLKIGSFLSLIWWNRRYVRLGMRYPAIQFLTMADTQSVSHIKITDYLLFRIQLTNRVLVIEEQGSSVPRPFYARASAQPLPKTHRTSISGEDPATMKAAEPKDDSCLLNE